MSSGFVVLSERLTRPRLCKAEMSGSPGGYVAVPPVAVRCGDTLDSGRLIRRKDFGGPACGQVPGQGLEGENDQWGAHGRSSLGQSEGLAERRA